MSDAEADPDMLATLEEEPAPASAPAPKTPWMKYGIIALIVLVLLGLLGYYVVLPRMRAQ